jgi:hypothetical protein
LGCPAERSEDLVIGRTGSTSHLESGGHGARHGITLIECELHERGEGYREAVVAQLVLLLVSATRLAAGQAEELHGEATGLLTRCSR